ncbi:hypothetical protein DTW90_25300 [Neorhizobium sp. P12A]|uniref:hypothetical protein n=1 Tax=Neorhizobium sp. P12A TaxID=2268027 RepID=UPI0011EBEE84|nr:hypothetical protein [Neorhizobium sp. P12A]KAA0693696.1 hypothetical protein DTW90_25300 [Neorhizobium sp. P12A]
MRHVHALANFGEGSRQGEPPAFAGKSSVKGNRFAIDGRRVSEPDEMAMAVCAPHLDEASGPVAVSDPKLITSWHLCRSQDVSGGTRRVVIFQLPCGARAGCATGKFFLQE